MDCENLREHYEAFALGALDPAERAEIEKHLARNCPGCTEGIAEARWLVSQLAYMAPAAEPPEAIRKQLLAAVRPKPEHRSWMPAWAWAGVAAALLIVALFSMNQSRTLQERAQALEAQLKDLRTETETYRKAFAIASASGSKAVTLTSTQPVPQLRAYWADGSGLVLTAQKLPVPAEDRTYQLWVIPKQGKPISAGIFRPDASGAVLLLTGPEAKTSDAAALAITNEPSEAARSQPPLRSGSGL